MHRSASLASHALPVTRSNSQIGGKHTYKFRFHRGPGDAKFVATGTIAYMSNGGCTRCGRARTAVQSKPVTDFVAELRLIALSACPNHPELSGRFLREFSMVDVVRMAHRGVVCSGGNLGAPAQLRVRGLARGTDYMAYRVVHCHSGTPYY